MKVGAWHALGALAILSTLTPFVSRALDLGIDVALGIEVLDHVVPGIAILAVAVLSLARRATVENPFERPAAATVCFLSGLFMTAAHVPLVVDASAGEAPWAGTIFMLLAGPPAAVISLSLLVVELNGSEPGRGE